MRFRFVIAVGAAIFVPTIAAAQSDNIDDALAGNASQESARAALDALTTAVPNPVDNRECLPPDAMHADVMTELHTELMMVSLVCDEPWNDNGLYNEYVDFTFRMEGLLTEALEDMEQHLRRTQGGNAFEAFNSYRTAMANEEALEMRGWGAATYCNIMVSRYNSLIDASPDAFEDYVDDIAGRALARVGVCD